MTKFYFVVDGTPEDQINPLICHSIAKEGLFSPSGPLNNLRVLSYCGFIITNDFIVVSLPKATPLPEPSNAIATCSILFRTLLKYSRLNALTMSTVSSLDPDVYKDKSCLSIFYTYNELLDDWAKFGQYKNRKNISSIGLNGRVNWKKTMSRGVPIFDDNMSPIYERFYTETRNLNLAGLVSEIHCWCVATADKTIGWLKNTTTGKPLFPDISHFCDHPPCTKETAVLAIKREMARQFDQRKLRLLRLMLAIFKDESLGKDIKMNAFGVRKFWPVWEMIVKELITTKIPLHSVSLPQPFYSNKDGNRHNKYNNIGQIPDLIAMDNDGRIYIIDAKYYDIILSAPGWKDIVKQFYYQLSLWSIDNSLTISNHFIFPSSSSEFEHPSHIKMDIPELAYDSHHFDGQLFKKLFPYINCEYISILIAMKTFIHVDKYDCVDINNLFDRLLHKV